MTDAEFNALKAARDSGVVTVSYQGRTVTYRTLQEIDSIIRKEEQRRTGTRFSFMRTRIRRDGGQ